MRTDWKQDIRELEPSLNELRPLLIDDKHESSDDEKEGRGEAEQK